MGKIKNWIELTKFVSERYDTGTSLEEILFLIGIQEYGGGIRSYSKDEKLALIKVAIYKMFSKYEFFKYEGRDSKNWPIWVSVENKEKFSAEEQEGLLRDAIIDYFNEICFPEK